MRLNRICSYGGHICGYNSSTFSCRSRKQMQWGKLLFIYWLQMLGKMTLCRRSSPHVNGCFNTGGLTLHCRYGTVWRNSIWCRILPFLQARKTGLQMPPSQDSPAQTDLIGILGTHQGFRLSLTQVQMHWGLNFPGTRKSPFYLCIRLSQSRPEKPTN